MRSLNGDILRMPTLPHRSATHNFIAD